MAIWQILQRVRESNTTLDTALLNCIAPPPLKRWLVRNRKTQRQHFSVQANERIIKWGKFKTGLTLLSVVPSFILIETWEWKWAHSVLRLLFLLTRGFIPTQETAFLNFFFYKAAEVNDKTRGKNKEVGKWLSYFVQSFVVNYMNKLNWLREVVRRIHACALSTVAE